MKLFALFLACLSFNAYAQDKETITLKEGVKFSQLSSSWDNDREPFYERQVWVTIATQSDCTLALHAPSLEAMTSIVTEVRGGSVTEKETTFTVTERAVRQNEYYRCEEPGEEEDGRGRGCDRYDDHPSYSTVGVLKGVASNGADFFLECRDGATTSREKFFFR
ncbi:MAG TPA: hypothetical protein VIH99_05155 [Bdellovibrionota bacterium]|jgi:hypothetical protein